MGFLAELKRRNVFRVGVAYLVLAWVVIQVTDTVAPPLNLPEWILPAVIWFGMIGFPFALFFAWAFELTPEGIKLEKDVDRSQSTTTATGRKVDVAIIGLLAVTLAFVVLDNYVLQETSDQREAMLEQVSEVADTSNDVVRATQQLLEVNRLRDAGHNVQAFALAKQIAPTLGSDVDQNQLFAGISWSTDIDSDPSGARVFIQSIDSPEKEWEDIGVTPLSAVRFPVDDAYRVRFELDGHHKVDLLHEALWGADYRGVAPINPVRLDPIDSLPEGMVRITGFDRDLVEYGDFFMDRFEVTNRQYARFVKAGGYKQPEFWHVPFIKDGDEINWEEAMRDFVDRTGRPGPATWTGGAYPDGQGDFPVSGVSWYEATAFARFNGKDIPTLAHFEQAMLFYEENSGFVAPRSNLGSDGFWSVGYNRAMNTMGLYDLIGNAREWVWNVIEQDWRGTVGAAWNDAPYSMQNVIPKSPWDRNPTNGFRLIQSLDGPEKQARLKEPQKQDQVRDFLNEAPASDAEFDLYLSFYRYDDLPLNATVVDVDTFDYWRRERVEFDLPSGLRGAVMLYIPKNATPPYEAIVYWSGSDALWYQSIDEEYLDAFGFLMKSGRVVARPIFWGTFDRDDADSPITPESLWNGSRNTNSIWYRDLRVTWLQELSRSIDLLEERDEIDTERLGFYGFSWGGGNAPIALAVESQRISVALLNVGGLNAYDSFLPEVDAINFVTRVNTPVLMINGEFDVVVPLDTHQKPLYELLGTDPEHKKWIVVPAAHLVPEDLLIREGLDWFDRYMSGVE